MWLLRQVEKGLRGSYIPVSLWNERKGGAEEDELRGFANRKGGTAG